MRNHVFHNHQRQLLESSCAFYSLFRYYGVDSGWVHMRKSTGFGVRDLYLCSSSKLTNWLCDRTRSLNLSQPLLHSSSIQYQQHRSVIMRALTCITLSGHPATDSVSQELLLSLEREWTGRVGDSGTPSQGILLGPKPMSVPS